jgi:uncharacterized protein YcfL
MFNKSILLLLVSFLLLNGCSSNKDIVFKSIDKLDLGNLSKSSATISGNVVFENLKEEVLNLEDMVLDLSIDGKDVGTIVIQADKIAEAKSTFTVPLSYTYETKLFVEEGHDPSSAYEVKISGDLTVKNQKGEEIKIPVKFSATIETLTNKERRIEKRESRKERRQERREERKARRAEKRNND